MNTPMIPINIVPSARVFAKVPDTEAWVSPLIGKNSAQMRADAAGVGGVEVRYDAVEPVAYLVEQKANTTLRGHFHEADQFQIFFGGEGRFGSKPMTGMHVHYASAFTPYAPIAAGTPPFRYLTLRNGIDRGAQFMPESKPILMARHRNYRAAVFEVPARPTAAPQDGMQSVDLMPFAADGLGVRLYSLAPNSSFEGPSPRDSRGQYWLELARDSSFAPDSRFPTGLVFIPPEAAAVRFEGGALGRELLLLQFARHVSSLTSV